MPGPEGHPGEDPANIYDRMRARAEKLVADHRVKIGRLTFRLGDLGEMNQAEIDAVLRGRVRDRCSATRGRAICRSIVASPTFAIVASPTFAERSSEK